MEQGMATNNTKNCFAPPEAQEIQTSQIGNIICIIFLAAIIAGLFFMLFGDLVWHREEKAEMLMKILQQKDPDERQETLLGLCIKAYIRISSCKERGAGV